MIPRRNKQASVIGKDHLKIYAKNQAPKMVMTTSATAMLKIRKEWIPFPGTPKASLYLHKFICLYYIIGIKNEMKLYFFF